MAAASVAAAWLLRCLILRRGWPGVVLGGASCALLTAVFYSSTILILEGIHGGSSPSGIAMGGVMGLYFGPVFLGLSAHVSLPAGILGAAVLRYVASVRDAGQRAMQATSRVMAPRANQGTRHAAHD